MPGCLSGWLLGYLPGHLLAGPSAPMNAAPESAQVDFRMTLANAGIVSGPADASHSN
jgi:hypothetical protein